MLSSLHKYWEWTQKKNWILKTDNDFPLLWQSKLSSTTSIDSGNKRFKMKNGHEMRLSYKIHIENFEFSHQCGNKIYSIWTIKTHKRVHMVREMTHAFISLTHTHTLKGKKRLNIVVSRKKNFFFLISSSIHKCLLNVCAIWASLGCQI